MNKEKLGGGSDGGESQWDSLSATEFAGKQEALPSDVLGNSSQKSRAELLAEAANDPANNEQVVNNLEEYLKGEVSREREEGEQMRLNYVMTGVLDGARLYAEASGGSIAEGLRKQLENYERHLQDPTQRVSAPVWRESANIAEEMLLRTGNMEQGTQAPQGEALPSDVL